MIEVFNILMSWIKIFNLSYLSENNFNLPNKLLVLYKLIVKKKNKKSGFKFLRLSFLKLVHTLLP